MDNGKAMKEDTYYVQSGKAKVKDVGNEKALYVGDQQAVHVLNPTAYLIYEAMNEPILFNELVEVVKEVTEGDEKTIREDLTETIELFMKYEFIKIAE
ncbi:PqqD family protein [Acidobacteriota bacterium]